MGIQEDELEHSGHIGSSRSLHTEKISDIWLEQTLRSPHLSSRQGTPNNEAEIPARQLVPMATGETGFQPWAALSSRESGAQNTVQELDSLSDSYTLCRDRFWKHRERVRDILRRCDGRQCPQ